MIISDALRFNSDLHTQIWTGLQQRWEAGLLEPVKKWKDYKRAEEDFAAYVPTTSDSAFRKDLTSKGQPQYTTLLIPYTMGMALTYHTYLASVFLARDPVFQYTGRHGESTQKIQAIEALISYQMQVGEMMIPLYLWLLDQVKYGQGVMNLYWSEDTVTVSHFEEVPQTAFGLIPLPGKTKKVKITEQVQGYKGNKLFNVNPVNFFTDPRVPLVRFQEGEFAGHQTRLSYTQLLQRGDEYFNLDVLRERKTPEVTLDRYNAPEARGNIQTLDTNINPRWTQDRGFFHIIEMCVNVIPKDWKLGDGTNPEKWMFTIADKRVIIGARPYGYYHNKFPYIVGQYEMNGYDLSSRGLMEQGKGMNDALSWLFNSHFFNTRKALNDQLVYDPSKVYSKDLEDGGPGKLIRLKPSAYGTDVRTAISQLQIVDITKQHMQDTDIIGTMMQRVFGITDNVMGMINEGGRKTATEIRESSSFAANRLKTAAEYNSSLGMTPLGQMLVQNTQQMYDDKQQFRIVGDLNPDPTKPLFVDVTPESIMGFFDYVPVDGTLPIDRYAQSLMWKDMMQMITQVPQIAGQYDIAGMFAWVAQLAGLKNIKQFRLQMGTPEQLNQMAMMGNAQKIPLGNAGGNGGGNGVPPGMNGAGVSGMAGGNGVGG